MFIELTEALKMRNIHIPYSYSIWCPSTMKERMYTQLFYKNIQGEPTCYLNRRIWTLIVEWWLHNIGYYLTKPFCKIEWFDKLNERFRDVDLEEWR